MDKFYRGFVGGVLAAIPLNLWSLFSFHILHLTDLRMLDWAAIMSFGYLPETAVQVAISLALQLLWSGFRGILFAHLFSNAHSQGYLGKGVIFSLVLSFIERTIGVLYKVPHLTTASEGTEISAIIGALLWGVLVAYLVRRFSPRERTNEAG